VACGNGGAVEPNRVPGRPRGHCAFSNEAQIPDATFRFRVFPLFSRVGNSRVRDVSASGHPQNQPLDGVASFASVFLPGNRRFTCGQLDRSCRCRRRSRPLHQANVGRGLFGFASYFLILQYQSESPCLLRARCPCSRSVDRVAHVSRG
jgi:hypothetical protein